MSVLYCTVPDRVKYSTVIADEYRRVPEKTIIGGPILGEFYINIHYFFFCSTVVSTNQVLASCFFTLGEKENHF